MFVLAVVQGATEFLPISSSGHLLLASRVFGNGLHPVGLDIVLHVATLLAVVLYFLKDLRVICAGVLRGSSSERSYFFALLFGTIPVALVGWFLYDVFDVFRGVSVVAVALIVSGLALIVIDYMVRREILTFGRRVPLWRKGFGIGLFQIFALLPGVSRSGATIAAGRLFGLSRREASRFSFLLSIPVICGALLVFLLRTPPDTVFTGLSFFPLFFVALTAFAIALTVIHFFLKLIERIGFFPFFIYQVLVGLLLLF